MTDNIEFLKLLTEDPYLTLRAINLASIGKSPNNDDVVCDFFFRKTMGETVAEWGEERYNKYYNLAYTYFVECFKAEHSTIENLHFWIYDLNARGDVTNQITRHTKGHPRYCVQSHRPDWNGGEKRKPSDETYGRFVSIWSPLSFMQMCRQRLCAKAQKETREWVKDVLKAMHESQHPFFNALADCCASACQYRGGICYEMKGCGLCPSYLNVVG